eukprot:scaffold99701_cov72-Phaeocystis_antarctica.AAC.1
MRTVARGQTEAVGGDRPSFSPHTCVGPGREHSQSASLFCVGRWSESGEDQEPGRPAQAQPPDHVVSKA